METFYSGLLEDCHDRRPYGEQSKLIIRKGSTERTDKACQSINTQWGKYLQTVGYKQRIC